MIPTPPLPDDDGSISVELQLALSDLAAGEHAGRAVLEAMTRARLLVPVVAMLDSTSDEAPQVEKDSSMAVVLLDSASHGRALLAFTGIDPLVAWNREARPVTLTGPLAARAAVAEHADALIVDVAGPAPFAVTGYELLLLASVARGQGSAAADPVLTRAIRRVLAEGVRFELRDGGKHDPARLTIEWTSEALGTPSAAGQQERQAVVEKLAADRVVAQLLPQGLHVSFGDTPG